MRMSEIQGVNGVLPPKNDFVDFRGALKEIKPSITIEYLSECERFAGGSV